MNRSIHNKFRIVSNSENRCYPKFVSLLSDQSIIDVFFAPKRIEMWDVGRLYGGARDLDGVADEDGCLGNVRGMKRVRV